MEVKEHDICITTTIITVKPVLKTTCVKRSPPFRDHVGHVPIVAVPFTLNSIKRSTDDFSVGPDIRQVSLYIAHDITPTHSWCNSVHNVNQTTYFVYVSVCTIKLRVCILFTHSWVHPTTWALQSKWLRDGVVLISLILTWTTLSFCTGRAVLI